jgi:hypothetical protein|eukprot:COSAG03_NODE_5340_length_1271_cov_3.134812_1_plen_206_part_00
MPQAIGCATSQTRGAYRIDDYPTPASRWCEYMAENALQTPPTVTKLDDGLALRYSCASWPDRFILGAYLAWQAADSCLCCVTVTSGSISRSLTVNLLCSGGDLPAPEAGATGGPNVVMNWPTAAACSGSGMTGWYIVIVTGVAAVRPDKHFLLPQSFPHTKLISRCGAGTVRGWGHWVRRAREPERGDQVGAPTRTVPTPYNISV